MKVGTLEETVTVTGESPVVDTQNTVQQRVISKEVLDALPVGKSFNLYTALVPGARHITDTNSGHEIHKEQPRLVTDAILAVVEAVRAGKTRLDP